MKTALATEKLRDFYKRHNRMPSYTEMARMFHYSSRGATYYLVSLLIKQGIIEKDETGKLLPRNLFSIPMYGIIKAGYPMPVDVQEDRQLNLHVLFKQVTQNSFALTVSGDSMMEEGINSGDIVFVSKDVTVKNGDIVAACVDGEWTVKYFQKQGENVSLVPANKRYPVMYPRETLEIGGVVTHVIRSYR